MASPKEGFNARRYGLGGFYPGQGEGGNAGDQSGFASIGGPGGSQNQDPTGQNPYVTNSEAARNNAEGQSAGETGSSAGGFNPSITGVNTSLMGQGLSFVGNMPGQAGSAFSALGSAMQGGPGFSNLQNENGPVNFARNDTVLGMPVPSAVAKAAQSFGLRGGQFTGVDPQTGEMGVPLPGFEMGGPQGPGIQGPGMTSLGRSGEGRTAAEMSFAPPTNREDLTPSPTTVDVPGPQATPNEPNDTGLTGPGGQGPGPTSEGTAEGGATGPSGEAGSNSWQQGGFVSQGDPNAQQDDVPAMLHEGEFVIPKPAMEQLARKTGGYQQAAQQIKELVIRFAQAPVDKGMRGMESLYQKGVGRNVPRPTQPRFNSNQP